MSHLLKKLAFTKVYNLDSNIQVTLLFKIKNFDKAKVVNIQLHYFHFRNSVNECSNHTVK